MEKPNSKPRQKLRIAIEAQRIFRPHKHGMDIVALEMIRQLQKIDTENDYFIITRRDSDICLEETDNFRIVYLEGYSYPDWEQLSLRRWVNKHKPDILHCTSNTAPIACRCRLFLTLHDIIFLEKNYLTSINGGSAYQRFGNFYRRLVAPRVAKQAEVVFTVSNYQRMLIAQTLKLPLEKIKVTHNGVAPIFFEAAEESLRYEVRSLYNIPQRYLFYLGNTEPRKNLDGVLKAYDLLQQSSDHEIPALVIKGVDHKFLAKKLKEQKLSHLSSSITLIGYIKSTHLPSIYQMAEMLLFPSYSEGFGIPIIEAMASGIPVITSNVTSMPEVAGDAALLVNPSSPKEIAEAVNLLLSEIHIKQVLVEKGKERALNFTWEKLAQTVFKNYLTINNIQQPNLNCYTNVKD